MKLRRLIAVILCAAALCSLCGCGGMFEREYVAVSDYVPSAADSETDTDKITVRSFAELKNVLRLLVSEGEQESRIVFDAAYAGEVAEDMADACWQVRTQDALCAYCVENIAYDLSRVVTYSEAHVSISYSEAVLPARSVVRLSYTAGLEEQIAGMLERQENRLAVLVDRSLYGIEEVESLVDEVYGTMPATAPRQPDAAVKMFSGSTLQRLYEIRLDYGMDSQKLQACRAELESLEPFAELETDEMDEAHKAFAASSFLAEHVLYSEDPTLNGIYDALVGGEANSEGMAFAYVELCRRLGLESRVIYGQRNWQDYSWNIVKVEDDWYHVDNVLCSTEGYWVGFLLRDEDIWSNYRWDVSAYPNCGGPLNYAAVFGTAEENNT